MKFAFQLHSIESKRQCRKKNYCSVQIIRWEFKFKMRIFIWFIILGSYFFTPLHNWNLLPCVTFLAMLWFCNYLCKCLPFSTNIIQKKKKRRNIFIPGVEQLIHICNTLIIVIFDYFCCFKKLYYIYILITWSISIVTFSIWISN